jgi:uncharacterized protein YbjQ (UPF0145 family)
MTGPSDGGTTSGGPEPLDIRQEMRHAVTALTDGRGTSSGGSMTSDLSIDEELTLHAVGWEPVELVCGISLFAVPIGVWTWGQGEIVGASAAYGNAFASASSSLHRDCARAGGHGVVGVHVSVEVHRNHIDVALTGTAVRPVGGKRASAESVFVSDLSGRDFSLLIGSGWAPLGLAAGASFVYAPRRSAGTAIAQSSQNVELTNYTEAMYSAREAAMERMQETALRMKGTGVVGVRVDEGPMTFARHAVGFTAYGTVVRLVSERHQGMQPTTVLPLDDPVLQFDVASLRGD